MLQNVVVHMFTCCFHGHAALVLTKFTEATNVKHSRVEWTQAIAVYTVFYHNVTNITSYCVFGSSCNLIFVSKAFNVV